MPIAPIRHQAESIENTSLQNRKNPIFFLAGIFFLNMISRLGVTPLLPDIEITLGINQLAPNLAYIIAPLMAGLILTWHSWRMVLSIYGIVSLGLALSYARWGQGFTTRTDFPKLKPFKKLIRNPSILIIIFLFILVWLPNSWIWLALVIQASACVCIFPLCFAVMSMITTFQTRSVAVSVVVPVAHFLGSGGVPLGVGFLAEAGNFNNGFIGLGLLTIMSIPILYYLKTTHDHQ